MADDSDWDTPLQTRPRDNSATGTDDWDAPLTVSANTPAVAAPVQQMPAGAKRTGALGLNALYTGINHLLGMAGDVESVGDKVLPSWMTRPIGSFGTGDKTPAKQLFPTSETVSDYTGLGLEHRPDLTPQNAAERYGTAAVEALPNALALGGMGAVPALVTSEAGAMSAQGTKDLFPGNKWAPVVAGVIGSLAGGWGTNAVASYLGTRAAAKEFADAQAGYADAVEAARQGRYDATTGVSNIKSASQANLNATKDLAQESVEAAQADAQQTFQTAAKSWGTSTTPQQAGTALQAAARDWMTRVFPARLEALRAPLDAAIPGDTAVDLSNFNGALTAINKKAGSLQPLVDVLTKAMPRQLAKAGKAIGEAAPDAEGLFDLGDMVASGPTWKEVRVLRSTLGDAMKDPELVSKIGESNLQSLYRAATADLTHTAKANGAGDLWQAFNEGSTKLHNFVNNTLSKVVSSTDPAQESIRPEDVATVLLAGGKKGATDLAALQSELPGAVGELSSAQLSQGAEAWGRLSPEAQAVLVPDKVQRAGLNRALANTETASANAREVVRQATRDHADALNAAQADARAGNFDRSTAVVEARRRLAEAAAKSKPGSSIEDIRDTLAGMRKSAVGVLAANALGPVLHAVPGGTAGAELIAAVAPRVLHYGAGLLRNPRNVLVPLTGAEAGRNALAPDQASQPK